MSFQLMPVEKNFVYVPPTVADLDEKIEIWIRRAEENQIDISEQIILFKEELEEEAKREIFDKIVMKVCRNIKPPEGTYTALDEKLHHLTTDVFIPLSEQAKERGINASQEMKMLAAAREDALNEIREKELSPTAKEVIKLRQIVLKQWVCYKFMEEIFTGIISEKAEHAIAKDVSNHERTVIIESIKRDALSQLPHSLSQLPFRGSVFDAPKFCRKVLKVFQKNIELYDKDPEEYHEHADKEYFVVRLNERVKQLKASFRKNPQLIEQIEQIRAAALTRVGQEPLKDIKYRVEEAFSVLLAQSGQSTCAHSERFAQ